MLAIELPSKEDLKSLTSTFIIHPSNGATNVNYFLTITSNDLSHAKLYVFEVNTESDFSAVPIVKESKKPEIQYLLNPDTRYYARVKTDISDWGPTTTFVSGTPLSLSYVVNPADGDGGVSRNVKMTLNEIYDATQYIVQLSRSAAFDVDPETQTSSTAAVSFKRLSKATRYYVRVSTDKTPGAWGRTTTFFTIDPGARNAFREDPGMLTIEDPGVEYQIYANPYHAELTVLVQTLSQEPAEFFLSDVSGRRVENKRGLTNNYMSIGRDVPSGVYMLKIITSHGHKIVKVMKN